jgi:hypothetical protein
MLPEQHQEIVDHTPQPHPPAPAPRPQTAEPLPPPHTWEAYPLSGLEHLGLVTQQKLRPAVPTLREPEAAGHTSNVDVDQQLLNIPAGGDSLPNVQLPNVPLPDFILPNVSLPEEHRDGLVGEE